MFIDVGDRQRRSRPASCCRQPRHHRQKRRQHDARRAAVDRDDAGEKRDDGGDGARPTRPSRPATRAGRCPAPSRASAMSTVTPHTITMTRHGIRLIASPSSADPRQHQDDGASEGAHADVDLRTNMTLEDQRRDDRPSVSQCRRLERAAVADAGSSADSARGAASAGAEQLQAAEEEVAGERDHRMRERGCRGRSASRARACRCAPSGR